MTDLLALVRFVHLASNALLVGTFSILLLEVGWVVSGPPALVDPESVHFRGLLRRLGMGSLLVALGSALVWLGAEVALMSGRPLGQALTLSIIGTVLTRTAFGRLWSLRLAIFLLLGLSLASPRLRQAGSLARLRHLGDALLAGVAMGALAWTGHAAGTEGSARLPHLVADVVHLLATGLWLGGLLPLGLFLRSAGRSLTPGRATAACRVIDHFSALGLGCVLGLILTGLVNTWVLVGSWLAFVGTLYGHLLLLKLTLLALLLAVAGHSRLRLLPRLRAGQPASPDAPLALLLRRLGWNVLGETVLGAAILLVVGFLGITPPPPP